MRVTLHMKLEFIMTIKNEYISRWLKFVVQVKKGRKTCASLLRLCGYLYGYYNLSYDTHAKKKNLRMLINYERKFYFYPGNNDKLKRNFDDKIFVRRGVL